MNEKKHCDNYLCAELKDGCVCRCVDCTTPVEYSMIDIKKLLEEALGKQTQEIQELLEQLKQQQQYSMYYCVACCAYHYYGYVGPHVTQWNPLTNICNGTCTVPNNMFWCAKCMIYYIGMQHECPINPINGYTDNGNYTITCGETVF